MFSKDSAQNITMELMFLEDPDEMFSKDPPPQDVQKVYLYNVKTNPPLQVLILF